MKSLLQLTGSWIGKNCLQVMPSDPIEESDSTVLIVPILNSTFLRLDQTWSWKDQPQEGSMWIGVDPKTKAASVHWIDTWHNGTRVMPLTGTFSPQNKLIVNGNFSVPNSPDWGWRIEIWLATDQLHIDMFCVDPTGKEEGGVRAEFRRVG